MFFDIFFINVDLIDNEKTGLYQERKMNNDR